MMLKRGFKGSLSPTESESIVRGDSGSTPGVGVGSRQGCFQIR